MVMGLLWLLWLVGTVDVFADAQGQASRLKSAVPDGEIVRVDVDGDGLPDVIERWWNGKRARWLDENGDMRPDDTRGDQVGDVLQVDMNNDGLYDTMLDINVKWADLDKDGVPDFQSWVIHPAKRDDTWPHGHWMIFQNFDRSGVLGWMDWQNFKFDCWGYTSTCNWLPNYHGNSVFLKIHAPVFAVNDPRLNWENPFAFYDFDGDGVSEMAMRWLDPPKNEPGKSSLTGRLNEAFVTFDLDNDSGKGNETDYDMTLRGAGGPGVDYTKMRVPLPGYPGNPKFDSCFEFQSWRRIDEVFYMPHAQSYQAFFTNNWQQIYFVFDEDDDDHRWERVEIYYPTVGPDPKGKAIDIYSTGRWSRKDGTPGLAGHPQADTLGDRGEFDMDNSGKGRLYLGVFDRKPHLAGAEWGAWTVDAGGKFHGGSATPSPKPSATKVDEVVRYSDTDTNGFLDTVEYDYDGDRKIDFKVCLLDYKSAANPEPDRAELVDPLELKWHGLHAWFNQCSQKSWEEAQAVYRAAWRRGLTTPEMDKLAFASSMAEKYHHAYWLKERVFRELASHLDKLMARGEELQGLRARLSRDYYMGQFEGYINGIMEVPAR